MVFQTVLLFMLLMLSPAFAQDEEKQVSCGALDSACITQLIEQSAADIKQRSWRDQTYRELAKFLAAQGNIDDAIALIEKIKTPDTQAMTIRGIGMAAAQNLESPTLDSNTELWDKLRASAENIEHPPSYAIALTYIAMAQAFAKDNEGAWKTASEMTNDALRHKAFAETAEIQAESGDVEATLKSIAFIDSEAFRNKAYSITSKIFAQAGQHDHALRLAQANTNPYKKAQSLQLILDEQMKQKIESEDKAQ